MNINNPGFSNLLGAVIAVGLNLLFIALLTARLSGRSTLEHWLGLIATTAVLPLGYLLATSFTHGRPPLYQIQIALMIVYLIVELLLDYIFKFDFRSVRWMAITYVMLFSGATGGMIGVASLAGRGWMYASLVTFIVTIALAFYQRAKTGM